MILAYFAEYLYNNIEGAEQLLSNASDYQIVLATAALCLIIETASFMSAPDDKTYKGHGFFEDKKALQENADELLSKNNIKPA